VVLGRQLIVVDQARDLIGVLVLGASGCRCDQATQASSSLSPASCHGSVGGYGAPTSPPAVLVVRVSFAKVRTRIVNLFVAVFEPTSA
jgi:hypothetical protein